MKILMLTPYLPYPLLSGGQIRTYNLLKNLSYKHDITLFSFIRKEEERKYIPELKKFCRTVKVFKRRPAWDLRNFILASLTSYPFLVAIYLSKRLRTAVEAELASRQYDLIHAETFYVMPNIPKTHIPRLLVEQTIEYLGYQTYAQQSKLLPLKPFLYYDVAKIKYWEKYYWQKATRLVTMSAEDRQFIQNLSGKKLHIDVVANGVDIDHFNQVKKAPTKNPIVLFVGNFKWLPNRDAAIFLARDIWPMIKAKIPNAKLWIVGANPTLEIEALGKINGVTVEGEIPDIRDAFKAASVLLAPVRNGRGTRYKILESMASETPVVGTHLSVEGLDIQPGKHALVSDDPRQLAKYTTQVLQDKKLHRRLSTSGKELITKKYEWKRISKTLDNIYRKLGRK